jgi:hypothetical protein
LRHRQGNSKHGPSRTLGEVINLGANGADEALKLKRHRERVERYLRSNGLERDRTALEDALMLKKLTMSAFSVLLITRNGSEKAMREVAKVTELAKALSSGKIARPQRPGPPPPLTNHTPPRPPVVHSGTGQTRSPGSHRS